MRSQTTYYALKILIKKKIDYFTLLIINTERKMFGTLQLFTNLNELILNPG